MLNSSKHFYYNIRTLPNTTTMKKSSKHFYFNVKLFQALVLKYVLYEYKNSSKYFYFMVRSLPSTFTTM